jgi:hypothetical protein
MRSLIVIYAASAKADSGRAERPASTPPSIGRVVPVIQPDRSRCQEHDRLDHVLGPAVAPERVEGVNRVEHFVPQLGPDGPALRRALEGIQASVRERESDAGRR